MCGWIHETPLIIFFWSTAGDWEITFCQWKHHSSTQVGASYRLRNSTTEPERHDSVRNVWICLYSLSQAQWQNLYWGLKHFLCVSLFFLTLCFFSCMCLCLQMETSMFRHCCGHTLGWRRVRLHFSHNNLVEKTPSIYSQSCGVHTIEKSKLLITINSAVLYVSLCIYKRWVFFY